MNLPRPAIADPGATEMVNIKVSGVVLLKQYMNSLSLSSTMMLFDPKPALISAKETKNITINTPT